MFSKSSRVLIIQTAFGGFLVACTAHKSQPASSAPDAGVVQLQQAPATVTSVLTGRTSSTLASDVRPQIDGIIQSRLFVEGDVVKAGQPLYQVDPKPYQAAVALASANLENAVAAEAAAQAQAARYQALTDVAAVSKLQIDNAMAAARQATATVHQARAQLDSARINLNYTLIRAPISGHIGRSTVTPGALVTANQTAALASIQKLDPIYVDLTQSSDALAALRRAISRGSVLPARASVQLQLQDGTTYPHAGVIEFTEVTVSPDSGTVAVRARFPNPDGSLLPGMFVRVSVPQAIYPQAILAPQQGITRDPKGNTTALVVGSGNKVVQRDITVQQAVGNKWIVTGGLKSGDHLIVEGTDQFQPGEIVHPVAAKIGR